MTPLNIPVLYGSMREGRASEPAARYLVSQLKARAVETSLVLPGDYRGLKSPERTSPKPWSELMMQADALIIVTPEYNHGYPGALKEMLDSLLVEYAKKPVAICGCSSGMLGGARAVEQLRQVVIELHMVPMKAALYFPNIRDLFSPDGVIKDAAYEKRCDVLFEELFWYARVLKAGREGKV